MEPEWKWPRARWQVPVGTASNARHGTSKAGGPPECLGGVGSRDVSGSTTRRRSALHDDWTAAIRSSPPAFITWQRSSTTTSISTAGSLCSSPPVAGRGQRRWRATPWRFQCAERPPLSFANELPGKRRVLPDRHPRTARSASGHSGGAGRQKSRAGKKAGPAGKSNGMPSGMAAMPSPLARIDTP